MISQRTNNYDFTSQEQAPQTQPPPYQGYPQYPYYPPQYAPPYPPEPNKDSKMIIIIVVVVVILVVVLPIIIAGVLYVWVSGFDTPDGGGGTVKISAVKAELTNAYKITIASVSGGDLNLEDAIFELSDDEGTRLFQVQILIANPTSLSKGLSKIYPIPSDSTTVKDITTGNTVTSDSELNDYTDCYLAFVDQNNDEKLNANDAIWIYKDWTRDGTPDVLSGYSFIILDTDHEMVLKKLL